VSVYEEMVEAFRSGENERTRRLSSWALEAADASGDTSGQVDALCMLARVALRKGDFVRVRELADQARDRARAGGDERLEQMPLHMRAVAARMSGRHDEARRLYEQSLELSRALGDERMVAAECHNLAYVELHDGRPDRAKELFARARTQAGRIGYEAIYPYLVADLAIIAELDRDFSTAARLAGAASAAFAAAGQVPDPDDAAEQQHLRDRLTENLGGERTQSLYEEGGILTPAEILDNPSYSGET
jgi:ATP/maltotriose-dependent transcriptional regulator MalT